ncbi:hypothetical protein [Bacillus sp. SYJ]|uniref:hypothetical protein n=1 Tax=Bacillus sp. SYJ TaxID=2529386 RepID=UPI0013F2A2E7|nr:hypothetical protein [Bacillus sp. SYJ]
MQGKIQQEFLATFNKLNMKDIIGDVKESRKTLDDLMAWRRLRVVSLTDCSVVV